MEINMKYYALIITFLLSSGAYAAAKVNYLNVEGDIVVFTTDEIKTATSPSCVMTATAQQWSVSLTSPSGRTLYSLLATSLAGGLNVTVTSANDCSDLAGIEKALSITVEPIETASTTPKNPSASGSVLYLYKGDGVTKLGPIINYTNGHLFYSDPTEPRMIQGHRLQGRKSGGFFYATEDCSSEAFATGANAIGYDLTLNGGTYYKTGGQYTSRQMKAMLNGSGECQIIGSNNYNTYTVDFSYVDPLCGEHACMVKEG
jgi:hypothetical protein